MSEVRVAQSAVGRMALRPQWLGALAIVIALCVVFVQLGRWQLHVAKSKEQRHHVRVLDPVALDSVVRPQQTFRNDMVARPVTVTGQYDRSKQLLVSGRELGGVQGYWVLTGFRTPAGATVPVVRGFVSRSDVGSTVATSALEPPDGQRTLSGTLEPPDPAPAGGDSPDVPVGQLPAADTPDVVNAWGSPIYNVLLYTASPAGSLLQPVPAPPANAGGGLDLQNAAYAVQWWLFAVFALLLWWRMVRQAAVEAATPAAAPKELSIP